MVCTILSYVWKILLMAAIGGGTRNLSPQSRFFSNDPVEDYSSIFLLVILTLIAYGEF